MFLIKEKDEFSLDLNPLKGLREIYYEIIKENDPHQSCGSEYFGRIILKLGSESDIFGGSSHPILPEHTGLNH